MSTVLPANKLATGDSASGQLVRYSFLVPNDDWIVRAIYGFFIDYVEASSWYKVGVLTEDEAAQVFAQINNTLGVDLATIGAIVPFAGGILPSGWLPCDGASYLKSAYPNLWAAIGNVWGSVDADHFNVPDLRGRVLLGQGTASSGTTFNLGQTGGEETHTLTAGEMPSHTHTDAGHSHSINPFVETGTAVPPPSDAGSTLPIPTNSTGSAQANIQNTGGDGAHNNMQPWAGVNYAIIAG